MTHIRPDSQVEVEVAEMIRHLILAGAPDDHIVDRLNGIDIAPEMLAHKVRMERKRVKVGKSA